MAARLCIQYLLGRQEATSEKIHRSIRYKRKKETSFRNLPVSVLKRVFGDLTDEKTVRKYKKCRKNIYFRQGKHTIFSFNKELIKIIYFEEMNITLFILKVQRSGEVSVFVRPTSNELHLNFKKKA